MPRLHLLKTQLRSHLLQETFPEHPTPSRHPCLPRGIHSQPPSPVSAEHNTGKIVCCVVNFQPWLYQKFRMLLKLSMPRSDFPENPIKLIRGRAQVGASQEALVVKNPPASAGDVRDRSSIPGSGRFLGGRHGNPLQYSLPGESHRKVEPGGLQSIGLQRVGHD